MRMFRPYAYYLSASHLEWVLMMPEKAQDKAYKRWKARLDKIDKLSMECWPNGVYYDKLTNVWIELYERCAAIKWPDMVDGIEWPEDANRSIACHCSRGTMIMRVGGKDTAVHTGDINRIGPEFQYELIDKPAFTSIIRRNKPKI